MAQYPPEVFKRMAPDLQSEALHGGQVEISRKIGEIDTKMQTLIDFTDELKAERKEERESLAARDASNARRLNAIMVMVGGISPAVIGVLATQNQFPSGVGGGVIIGAGALSALALLWVFFKS